MIGTATGALALLGLPDDVLEQANITTGACCHLRSRHILTLLFSFVAPWLK